ncbi:MAG: Crp/Fnr family transcriptional regulator [Gammaproteobacteria bacterium]|nr:Crp/Fnr family transcriptional regulator [Gammaproteobacteria bacterium]
MATQSVSAIACPFDDKSCIAAISKVEHLCKKIVFKPGEVVCRRGEYARSLPIVIDGELSVKRYSRNGAEIVLDSVVAGECCFVSGSSLLASTPCMADVTAEVRTLVWSLPKPAFLMVLSRSEEFSSYVFRCLELGMSQVADLIENISSVPVEQRLSQLLLQLCDSHLEVRKRHSELAAKLGTAREVVSRTLKTMEHRNVVELRRCCISLRNVDELKSLAHAV